MGILRITIRNTISQIESGATSAVYRLRSRRLGRRPKGDRPSMTTEPLRALIESGEEHGCINLSEFSELVQDLELGDEELSALYEQLEERHVELTDDCGNHKVADSTYVIGDLATMTTD